MKAIYTSIYWGYPTLTFDISIFDITMLIAIIVLFTLYLTSTPKESSMRKTVLKKVINTKKPTQNPKPQKTQNNNHTNKNPNCPHHYGYLKTHRDKNKNIPEECVGCTKLVQCLFTEE
jgi:hypothetical protein